MDSHELDFIEVIQLLKQLNSGISEVQKSLADLDLNVKVDAPVINVEPTPIEVNEAEHPTEIKAVITNLDELGNYVKEVKDLLNQPVKVANLNEIKQVEPNLSKIEGLLDKLLKVKTNVAVKVEPNIEMPTGYDPKKYVPVRLTDGTGFYNALTTLVKNVTSNSILEYEQIGNYMYVGEALTGTSTSQPKWNIEKYDLANGSMRYAKGAWSNKEGLSYA